MDTKSVPAPPPTRELRGIKLYWDHADEIERILPHTYSVPSCSGETTYTVRLAPRVRCSCPDRVRPCKHLLASELLESGYRKEGVTSAIRRDARRHPERTYSEHVVAAVEIAAVEYREETRRLMRLGHA